MKTDRELLELAALAAGIVGEWVDDYADYYWMGNIQGILGVDESGGTTVWNPLTDDGDALRLAMRLGFTVEPGRCWHSPYGPAFGEDVLDGYLKSTRRAIVRAAAAIGESMK